MSVAGLISNHPPLISLSAQEDKRPSYQEPSQGSTDCLQALSSIFICLLDNHHHRQKKKSPVLVPLVKSRFVVSRYYAGNSIAPVDNGDHVCENHGLSGNHRRRENAKNCDEDGKEGVEVTCVVEQEDTAVECHSPLVNCDLLSHITSNLNEDCPKNNNCETRPQLTLVDDDTDDDVKFTLKLMLSAICYYAESDVIQDSAPATSSGAAQNAADTRGEEQVLSAEHCQNQTLDNFQIIKKIGTGMMGSVYLANDTINNQMCALKTMVKRRVIQGKQTAHVMNEKEVLMSGLSNPFIVNIFDTFADHDLIFICLEYVPGGELYSHLRRHVRFPVPTARFYACQIVSALSYLHSRNIIYRDLKPENIVLDSDGNSKLVDFGFAKKVVHSTWSLCGTPKYLAPEIVLSRSYTKAVDWWTLGILLYEMLTGNTPFDATKPNEADIYPKIINGVIEWPVEIFSSSDDPGRDLVKRLLTRDPHKRLGTNRNGSLEVKRHQWFKLIKWDQVNKKQYVPPIVPAPFDANLLNGESSNYNSRWRESLLRQRVSAESEKQPILANHLGPDPFKNF